ncbi:glycine betaine/proline transport system permease protein [Nonomuraea polychroma]|uniref:Glycine betaine/proline transport system permease protein n=1 Tax=Nonomuraea polychroma TaxID=46176 RepID=A0A438LZY7_9ACTN|nr:ABC transporter permease subunit [Nonomuraea polychroma]RVX38971.1 glycine betaine/proline transport system permease protein [Nonomuraea polychroma]
MPDLPVDTWVESTVRFLQEHFSGVFDVTSALILRLVDVTYVLLIGPHPLVLLAFFTALAWLATRRWQPPLVACLAFLLIQSMAMWTATMQTLAVVVVAAVAAVAVGIPLGIAAARSTRVSAALRPVLDFMQTLPVFVYLLPAVFFFGIGVMPGVVATTVFAIPPAVRLTELGIRQVDAEIVEAAHAFGSRSRQILRDVQLPLAMPTIMAGVNQVIMMALSMVVIAGMVGGGGLGAVVVEAVTQLDIGRGFEGGLSVVILAIYLDRVSAAFGDGRGRARRRRTRQLPDSAPAPEEGLLREPAERVGSTRRVPTGG